MPKKAIFWPLFYHFFCHFLPLLGSILLWIFQPLKMSDDLFEISKWKFLGFFQKKPVFIALRKKWNRHFFEIFIFEKSQGLSRRKIDDFYFCHFLTRFKMVHFFKIWTFTLKSRRNFLFFLKKVIFFVQKSHFFVIFLTFSKKVSMTYWENRQKWRFLVPFLTPFLHLFFHFFCSIRLFLGVLLKRSIFVTSLKITIFVIFLSLFITFFNFTLENTLKMAFYRFFGVPQKGPFFDVFWRFLTVFGSSFDPLFDHFYSFLPRI